MKISGRVLGARCGNSPIRHEPRIKAGRVHHSAGAEPAARPSGVATTSAASCRAGSAGFKWSCRNLPLRHPERGLVRLIQHHERRRRRGRNRASPAPKARQDVACAPTRCRSAWSLRRSISRNPSKCARGESGESGISSPYPMALHPSTRRDCRLGCGHGGSGWCRASG